MQLPLSLSEAIETIIQNTPPSVLKRARETFSSTYKKQQTSETVFNDEIQRLAYLAARLPATYGAVTQVLSKIAIPCHHLLDLGAGPGTASLAAIHMLPDIKKLTLVESNPHAIALGKELSRPYPLFDHAEWICASLPCPLPSADVAILSYSLGEIKDPISVITDWQNSKINCLIVIEPGTPSGFQLIKKIREQLIEYGASLLAPCPHIFACPMKENDWCHFSARIDRTKIHRYLKEGSLGYEDEKYSYLVALRKQSEYGSGSIARIVRRPQKHTGHVKLTLCKPNGLIEEITITKKNKTEYRQARSSDWGDSFLM